MAAAATPQLFAVDVKYDCPHLALHEDLTVDIQAPCLQCANVGENWLCLTCSEVLCSRYVNCHMVDHNAESQHPVALSFSDASVWCYSCDSYIDSPCLKQVTMAVALARK